MGVWQFEENQDVFDLLVSAYSEKGRHYHTHKHLDACLENLDACVDQTDHPNEVELALWFHDAIYRPLSGKNEADSAKWATSFLLANGESGERLTRIRRLILATKHEGEVRTKDESLLLDVDLAILGADCDTYEEYERSIRSEYRLVPSFVYRKKRASLLQSFLRRDWIYQNEPFRSRLEAQARKNLTDAVSKLSRRA